MATISSNDDLIPELLDALGLADKQVTSFAIKAKVGDLVRAKVEFFVDPISICRITNVIKKRNLSIEIL